MNSPQNEFDLDVFAEHYEAITDTFIDVSRAASSLVSAIAPVSRVFELGLGTGYFAEQLLARGVTVEGIQPPDRLLPYLKRLRPHIAIAAECRLEDYEFDSHHDAIVSHSSVFLCTRQRVPFGVQGEVLRTTAFQSFIRHPSAVIATLERVVDALTPRGRLWINIQENPLRTATVGSGDSAVRFEMVSCEYDLWRRSVVKRFRLTRGDSVTDISDCPFFMPLEVLRAEIAVVGLTATICEDDEWLVVERSR